MLVIKTGLFFPMLKDANKNNSDNFDAIIGKDEIPQRKADVLAYADAISGDWAPPLFVSGTVFGQKGVAYMLDGARRIVATVLRGWLSAPALLVVTKSELCGYFNQHDIERIRERAKAVSWFPNYQAVPEVGIDGQRTGHRLKMFDLTAIKGKTIADFGCNIGQACLEYCYAGAKSVAGFDCQQEAIITAISIARIMGHGQADYTVVDFNDREFYRHINHWHPVMFDYSSFLAVYRTKELTQREALFQYVIDKTRYQIFFEGHADPAIDTIEYYVELFAKFNLSHKFVGYSEPNTRPCFVLERKG
jgi:hypothetical protein